MKKIYWWIALNLWLFNLTACINSNSKEELEARISDTLILRHAEGNGTISVYREGSKKPILVQHAKPDFRPFIHPIVAPDGKGTLTENSPGHHKHQTGLYWGFTKVNGRDYFHNPGADYW